MNNTLFWFTVTIDWCVRACGQRSASLPLVRYRVRIPYVLNFTNSERVERGRIKSILKLHGLRKAAPRNPWDRLIREEKMENLKQHCHTHIRTQWVHSNLLRSNMESLPKVTKANNDEWAMIDTVRPPWRNLTLASNRGSIDITYLHDVWFLSGEFGWDGAKVSSMED